MRKRVSIPLLFLCNVRCSFFEAVWRFCVDVVVTRAGRDPAKFAATFLANITTEAVIQAAMMADAADEHMLTRRFRGPAQY